MVAPQVANLVFGPADSEMNPLNLEKDARNLKAFKAFQMTKQSNELATPLKGSIIDANDGFTGTLKVLKTERIQSVARTTPKFSDGALRAFRSNKGISVG
jgi:hypothetical protein